MPAERMENLSLLHNPKAYKTRIFYHAILSLGVVTCLFFITSCKRNNAGQASQEMVLNERIEAKIQTLDPADIGDTTSDGVCREFHETLYGYDYLKRPLQVVPELADGMPDIQDDGKTYRIAVKKGVYFHNDACFPDGKGRRLTAHDFVYAFKRIANVKVQS